MNQIERILYEIKELRGELNNLINGKTKFIEPQVIGISKKLDVVLNMYNELNCSNSW